MNDMKKAIALTTRIKLRSGHKFWNHPEIQFVGQDFTDQDFLNWIKSRVLAYFPIAVVTSSGQYSDGLEVESVLFTASMRSHGSTTVKHLAETIYSREDCLIEKHWETYQIDESEADPMP